MVMKCIYAVIITLGRGCVTKTQARCVTILNTFLLKLA